MCNLSRQTDYAMSQTEIRFSISVAYCLQFSYLESTSGSLYFALSYNWHPIHSNNQLHAWHSPH